MSNFATQKQLFLTFLVSCLRFLVKPETRNKKPETRNKKPETRNPMLSALITSKTRIKLMLKFFLNSSSTGYLRGLAAEFGESTNAIRLELNRFEQAGLLSASSEGNRKVFRANTKHPLFDDIKSIVRKYVGMDEIIDQVINHLGEPEAVYLIGDLALGIESKQINIIIVGENMPGGH